MSTTITLNQLYDSYVSLGSPSTNYDSATSLYMMTTSRDVTTRRATALLQFQTPSILKYKKIVSAFLNFTYNVGATVSYDPTVGYLFEFYLAALSAESPITGITENTLGNYGSYSTTAVVYTDSLKLSSGSGSKSLSIEISDLLKNNLYNDYFTAAITCWGQLSGNKTIASKETNSNVSLVITYDDIEPLADTPIYPLDVYLNQSDPITFRWKFNSESQVTQKSYVLKWKKKTDSTYTTLATGGTELKYTAPANTFPVGEIDWSITSTDILGNVTPIAYGSFTVVGKPTAPNITSFKNDALTTITWNSTDQSARELQLLKDGVVIASENTSSPSTEYSPLVFLKNGPYEFRIRIMTAFGYWSDWTSYIFTISATEPSKPTLTHYVDKGNVVLEVSNGTGRVFLYRVEDDVEMLIAELNETSYADKTMKFNASVKYFARSYSNGVMDSDVISTYVSIDGFALSVDGEMLRFRLSEDQFLSLSESLSTEKTLSYYDGRELPVLESSEHVSHVVERKTFVAKRDWNLYKKILLSQNPVLYRDSNGNKMFCIINGQSSEYKQILNGMIISISLTEVYYDEAVTIDG